MKFLIFIIFFIFIANTSTFAQRQTINFNSNWKFSLQNDNTVSNINYNDGTWRSLSIPHDWSIENNFTKDAAATNQGGALPGGVGWYRKTFSLPFIDSNKIISILFDGVYRNSEVWINGQLLGKCPNGYISFEYNLTPFIKFGSNNVIAVKVDNSQQPNSRWYSGSGIYRDVKLIVKNKISFKENGIFITTENMASETKINIRAEIETLNSANKLYQVKYQILNSLGVVVKNLNVHSKRVHNLHETRTMEAFIYAIKNPVLWTIENPYLYKLKANLIVNGYSIDEVIIPFGIRTTNFTTKGFLLNNKLTKIKGVCMHHDLGALGAAFNKAAAKRQLTILKNMGCNAIRFSHNPPAAEMLNLCDQMGFLVIDDAFDMWKKKKNKYDYSIDFTEWHKKDLEAMILRDRNHPSIIAWSIGNEIREQFDSTGIALTKNMVNIVKTLDSTRFVTSALTETVPEKNFIYQSKALDILGFNYKIYDYENLPNRFANLPLIATETASALSTRGVYNTNADSINIWPPDSKPFTGGNTDFTTPAYDNTYAYWGNTHEKALQAVNANPHLAGCFVWSGFDFLGEPVPYPWPARSSYYGIIDLAGFPKDVYYMYQSQWTTKPVLHIFPHWNWQPGQEVNVWAYYNNADEVELFINNKSVGIRKKIKDEMHVSWKVNFKAGILKAVSRKNGNVVLKREIKTAGKPFKIYISTERYNERSNENETTFLTASIRDKDGNLVPNADNLITFEATGNCKILGTDNGYQADTVSLKSPNRKAWKGLALGIIQSTPKKGNSTVLVKSPGLKSASLILNSH